MQTHWEVSVIWRSGFPTTVYIWTVNIVRASKEPSEMFQTLMERAYYSWNVFLGAPDILCECWKIWSIFFCLSISRDMWTKRQSAFAASLGVRIPVHKRELVCAKKIVERKKTVKNRQRAKMQDSKYRSKNICAYLFSNTSHAILIQFL